MNKILLYAPLIYSRRKNLAADISRVAAYCDGFHIDAFDNSIKDAVNMLDAAARFSKPVEVHILSRNPGKLLNAISGKRFDMAIFQSDCNNLKHWMYKAPGNGICFMPGQLASIPRNVKRVQLFCTEGYPITRSFTPQIIKDIKTLRNVTIGVEGLVNLDNAACLIRAGADVLVPDFIFKTSYPREMSSLMRP